MSTATKGGKAATVKASATPKPKVTIPKKNAQEDVSYNLLKYQPLSFELKTGRDGNLLIFDEKTNDTRAIRHCPNDRSIYVDEQSSRAVVKPIVFINGIFNASAKDVRTKEFLNAHPSRGVIFDIVNNEISAQSELDLQDIILDIKTAIRKRSKEDHGVEELRVIVSALTSDIGATANMSPSELRFAAFELVDTNPYRFINDEGEVSIFDDSNITRKAIAQSAFAMGVVTLSPDARQVLWADNKSAICSVPTGKDYVEFFASYLATQDGISVLHEINKR